MPSVSLHDLIAALSGAVVQAQDAIEQHQLDLLSRHFDSDGRPISLEIMLPNTTASPSAENYQVISVPRLSLVEANFLRISEFAVEFDVELGDLGLSPSEATPPSATVGDPGLSAATPPSATVGDPGPSAANTPMAAAELRIPPSSMPSAPPGAMPSAPPGSTQTGATFFNFLRRGAPTGVPNIGPARPTAAAAPMAASAPTAGSAPASTAAPPDAAAAPFLAAAPDTFFPTPPSTPSPSLSVGVGPKLSNSTTAKATIKVTAQPISDGMARLLNHLNQTI